MFLIACSGGELYQFGEKVCRSSWSHTAENTYFVHDVEFLELMIEVDVEVKPKNKAASLKLKIPWDLGQVMLDRPELNRQRLQS